MEEFVGNFYTYNLLGLYLKMAAMKEKIKSISVQKVLENKFK